MFERIVIHEEVKLIPCFKTFQDILILLLEGNVADCYIKPPIIWNSDNFYSFKHINKHPVIMYSRTNKSLMTIWIAMPKKCKWNTRIIKWPFNIFIIENIPRHPYFIDNFYPNIKVTFYPPNNILLSQILFPKPFIQLRKTQRRYWKQYRCNSVIDVFIIASIALFWLAISQSSIYLIIRRRCSRGFKEFSKNEVTNIVTYSSCSYKTKSANDISQNIISLYPPMCKQHIAL